MELGEDVFGGFGPNEGLGVDVVVVEIPVDGGLKVYDGLEDAAPDAPSGQDREEILDGVEPGA